MTVMSCMAGSGAWPAQRLFDASSLPLGQLAAHQQSGLEWLAERDSGLLADPTGAGKTATACALLAHLIEYEELSRILWVTEAHLVGQTLRELRRFLPTVGSAPWTDGGQGTVAVISYDLLTHRRAEARAFEPEAALLDEASAVKNAGRRAEAVAMVTQSAWWRFGLTATPMEVEALEIYRLLQLLRAHQLITEQAFGRFLDWREFRNGDRQVVGIRPGALPALRRALAPHVLRREFHELDLVLPGLREQTVWVPLTPPQEAAYAAAGRIYDSLRRAKQRERACTAVAGRSAKAEAAIGWLRHHPGAHKALVWAENLGHLDVMEALLDRAGIGWLRIDGSAASSRRRDVTEAFRDDPAVRVLLGTRVLERGIDGLQHARVLLSLGSSFNPAREAQRLGRIRRPGSPHREVQHVTFLTDTEHERSKARTVQRRQDDGVAVLGPGEGIRA